MKIITKVALIGSLYAVLTILLAPISYGPVQVRITEALTVLPYVRRVYMWGLFGGCIVANIYGGLGVWDVIGGSLCTLLAGFLTSIMPKPQLAPLPPIVVNAFGVSLYLHFIFNLPYWVTVMYIALGEAIACFALGYPFLRWVLNNKDYF
ncbi:MAG: QueT transporter family protein [Synergistetes bacterium]|nr:QueT transporter family protein [Synergistota bacterium]MDW8192517.1 QueT transporter family protein [Synergistota bacterium]